MFTKDFAKEIFRGEKKLIKRRDLKSIDVPKFDELSVKHLYDKFLSLPMMNQYFPSKYPKGRGCDRDYMFCVANTLYEETVFELIKHALEQRYAVDGIKMKDESVLINDHWADELKSLPLVCNVSAQN